MGTYENDGEHGRDRAWRLTLAPTHFLGMGLWLIWIWGVANPTLLFGLDPTSSSYLLWTRAKMLLRASALGTFAVCMSVYRTPKSPRRYRAVLTGGTAASVIGSLGLGLILHNDGLNLDLLAYASAVAVGAGAVVLFLGWSVAYAGLPRHLLVQTSALTLAFASVAGCAATSWGPQPPFACLAALPVPSFVMLRSIDERPGVGTPLDRVRSGFPWRLVAMLGWVSFACGVNPADPSVSEDGGVTLWLPAFLYGISWCLILPVLAITSQRDGSSAVIAFGLTGATVELMRVFGACSRLLVLAHPFGPPALLGTLPVVLSICFTGLIVFRLVDGREGQPQMPEPPEPTVPLQFTATTTPYRPQPNFTRRESEVVEALIDGLTYQQISEELTVTMSTVKTHVHHVYRKLGVTNRNDAVSIVIGERQAREQAGEPVADPACLKDPNPADREGSCPDAYR